MIRLRIDSTIEIWTTNYINFPNQQVAYAARNQKERMGMSEECD